MPRARRPVAWARRGRTSCGCFVRICEGHASCSTLTRRTKGERSPTTAMTSDEHRDGPERLVKVVIDTNGHWSGIASESLWAAPTDDGYYQLRNSPFYAYGLSWGDVVEALPFGDDAAGQRLRFQTVMRRG